MTIALRPLTQLDPDAVAAALAETVQRVQEDNPRLDLRRGVFAELLAYYHAVLDTQRRTFTNDVLNSRSLKAIEADPELADPDAVDDIMSNFRVTRQSGQVATGEVTIVLSDDITVTIAQGSVWSARGKQFVTTRVYTAKAEAALVSSPSDRLLTQLVDGNWAFTIDVQAVAEGEAYTVPRETLVVPEVIPPNYVTSFASSDFKPGFLAETNTELLARLQEGVAAKALSNRVNMAATLRDVDAFSRITAMSIVGYGDAELVRAYHSVLPIAMGGRCDWYIRTTEQPTESTSTVSATLVTKHTDGTGTWQFAFGKDTAPGVYEFRGIRPLNSEPLVGGYAVTSDVRGLDLTGSGWQPDLVSATEAAYSPYATAVVQFLDTRDHQGLTVGAVREYRVSAAVMPQIADIQALVSSRDVRPYGGDVLVKAPVPAFTVINFTIYKRTGQADPNLSAIQTSVAKAVNTAGFSGSLYASRIQDAIRGHLDASQSVGAIDMHARIRRPLGTVRYLRSAEVLEVPSEPGEMVTERTVQFLCANTDVGISVVTRSAAGM